MLRAFCIKNNWDKKQSGDVALGPDGLMCVLESVRISLRTGNVICKIGKDDFQDKELKKKHEKHLN